MILSSSRMRLGAFCLMAALAHPGFAQETFNTTTQIGKVNINRTFQCGDVNTNSTYQEGKVNINKTVQTCRSGGRGDGRGEGVNAKRADPPKAEPALAAKGQQRRP